MAKAIVKPVSSHATLAGRSRKRWAYRAVSLRRHPLIPALTDTPLIPALTDTQIDQLMTDDETGKVTESEPEKEHPSRRLSGNESPESLHGNPRKDFSAAAGGVDDECDN